MKPLQEAVQFDIPATVENITTIIEAACIRSMRQSKGGTKPNREDTDRHKKLSTSEGNVTRRDGC